MAKYTGKVVQTQAITFAEPVAIDTVTGNFTVTGVVITNGTPSSPNHAATKNYVDTQLTTEVNNLVNAAPGTLDTLNELAAALGDDANFSTTVTNSLATKQDKFAVDGQLSATITSATVTSDKAYVGRDYVVSGDLVIQNDSTVGLGSVFSPPTGAQTMSGPSSGDVTISGSGTIKFGTGMALFA